jgi:hypothetical protein
MLINVFIYSICAIDKEWHKEEKNKAILRFLTPGYWVVTGADGW